MNPIEEMMKKYGVEPEIYETPGRDWDDEGLASWYTEKVYPPFTPEKQLEILQFIMLHPEIDEIRQYYNEPSRTWNITAISLPEMGQTFSVSGCNNDYASCLAELMTTFSQILTPNQRQQIKEILEK